MTYCNHKKLRTDDWVYEDYTLTCPDCCQRVFYSEIKEREDLEKKIKTNKYPKGEIIG